MMMMMMMMMMMVGMVGMMVMIMDNGDAELKKKVAEPRASFRCNSLCELSVKVSLNP